ncbi:MAG: CpsD/CapB family tyrosine-protein kinase [Gammaproteobacteria bacterium]
MERIKQALARAREERQSGDVSLLDIKSREDHQAIAQNDDLNFEYTQTKIFEPDQKLLKKNRILIDKDHDRANAAYKLLRTQVEQRMLAKNWNTLAITSPGPNHGKSLTSINLAISLAKSSHHTVLLVDLDMRKPSVHRYFGYEPEYGIYDCISEDLPLEKILVNPGIERLVLAPGKQSIYNSSELLASPNMGKLVDEMRNRYRSRYIIFDLPPVLATDDAMAFSPYVDATLLVLEDGVTVKDQLKQTLEMLQGTEIIGTVLNKSKSKKGNYYYYYY